jgi:hypothetical protein
MPDIAQVNRSISTLKTELEYLRESGVLLPQQYDSILAQLPQDGQQSSYVDPRYGGQQWGPPPQVFNQMSAAAQNPQSPANPDHPKVSRSACEHKVMNAKSTSSITSGRKAWRRSLEMR